MSHLPKLAAQLLTELFNDPGFTQAIQPFIHKLGQHIAESTASAITERHAAEIVPPADAAIPVQDLCRMMKISEPTFRKHFIDNGKLEYIPTPPKADRRRKYVSAQAWASVSREASMKVVSINRAA